MANINNAKFKDAIDKLNKIAYMLVDGNAKAWAAKAVGLKIITYKERARIEQLVDLRNSMGHGNAEYINVGQNEVNEANKYVRIMSNTSEQIKRAKTSSTTQTAKTTSNPGHAAQEYFQHMYGYNRSSSSPAPTPSTSPSTTRPRLTAIRGKYEFVDAPPKVGLFGKTPDNYGWVICNHANEFLKSTSYIDWTISYGRAVVFKTEREAQKQVNLFLKDSTSWKGSKPFLRVRCIKMY